MNVERDWPGEYALLRQAFPGLDPGTLTFGQYLSLLAKLPRNV